MNSWHTLTLKALKDFRICLLHSTLNISLMKTIPTKPVFLAQWEMLHIGIILQKRLRNHTMLYSLILKDLCLLLATMALTTLLVSLTPSLKRVRSTLLSTSLKCLQYTANTKHLRSNLRKAESYINYMLIGEENIWVTISNITLKKKVQFSHT